MLLPIRFSLALLAAFGPAAASSSDSVSPARSAERCQAATRSQAPSLGTMYPVDESHLDPAFAQLKRKLLRAAERGDIAFLREAMTPTLNVHFEGVSRDEFIRRMNLREGTPWRGLRDALRLGVTREEEHFCAPYVFTRSSEMRLAEGEPVLVITGKNVRVRARPDPSSPVIEVVSYDIVRLGPQYTGENDPDLWEREEHPQGPDTWAQIRTPSGKVGYVYRKFVRHPDDTRYYFKKVDGVWKLWAIAAGD